MLVALDDVCDARKEKRQVWIAGLNDDADSCPPHGGPLGGHGASSGERPVRLDYYYQHYSSGAVHGLRLAKAPDLTITRKTSSPTSPRRSPVRRRDSRHWRY